MKEDKISPKKENPAQPNSNKSEGSSSGPYFKVYLAAFILAILAIIIQKKDSFECFLLHEKSLPDSSGVPEKRGPTYWIHGKNNDAGHLKHVNLVLKRMGFNLGTNESDWDLLWAHDYPFTTIRPQMLKLKPHQRVNHFPGCGFITNKVDLATSDIKYIPKSFKLPKEEEKFREYARQHPKKLFVQKHNQHRHIYIKSLEEIDFAANDTFIQEFIDNPLLVDGFKFDMGVYTIITSIDPLRVYIYWGDVLFRYCPIKYYPFDANVVDKYIVGDDYLPTWEVPSLKMYYTNLGFGMKASFDAYLQSEGRDPNIVWDQVEDAIRTAILAKESELADSLKNYKYKRNFFEMMRFDLVVDNDLKVSLMEANMSPNLSSAHYKPNQLLYEQVIYHMLGLLGVGSLLERDSFRKGSVDVEKMLSDEKNIVVDAVACGEMPCVETCAPVKCGLCLPCLSRAEKEDLQMAYREHVNRGDTKRIFPPAIINPNEFDEEFFYLLTPKNQWMTKWFYEKCKMDDTWC